jgi:hypothetical protein
LQKRWISVRTLLFVLSPYLLEIEPRVPCVWLACRQWDEDLDNGFRPAGLIHLSETTVDNVLYIQDFGATYDSGSATHHLALHRAPSGALVFGAGTVQWSWGLDGAHDGAGGVPPERANPYNTRVEVDRLAPEGAVQQATVNLLADMSIQAASLSRSPHLRPASASSDHTPPHAEVFQVINPSFIFINPILGFSK